MTQDLEIAIKKRYEEVLRQVLQTAKLAGRSVEDVRLMVVTKGHPLEVVKEVVKAGANLLGENYAEQALPKIESLASMDLEWHMIGHVQSRKAQVVAENFVCVHSIDSLKIANRLNHYAQQANRTLSVLMECNVSHEESKFGWPAWNESGWLHLVETWSQICELPAIRVCGLMTMPPFDPDPEAARPYFAKLRRLRDFMAKQLPQIDWSELSMGMSADFEVAIQEGATIVRVGTAIVGPRS